MYSQFVSTLLIAGIILCATATQPAIAYNCAGHGQMDAEQWARFDVIIVIGCCGDI